MHMHMFNIMIISRDTVPTYSICKIWMSDYSVWSSKKDKQNYKYFYLYGTYLFSMNVEKYYVQYIPYVKTIHFLRMEALKEKLCDRPRSVCRKLYNFLNMGPRGESEIQCCTGRIHNLAHTSPGMGKIHK